MAAPLVTAVVVAMSLTAMSLAAPAAQADAPPFGQLPVMGYNTWYQFGAGVTESAVLKQADYLVSSGLRHREPGRWLAGVLARQRRLADVGCHQVPARHPVAGQPDPRARPEVRDLRGHRYPDVPGPARQRRDHGVRQPLCAGCRDVRGLGR